MWDINKKYQKKSKGSLTIEASIALTAFVFLVVTILGFGRLYQAQQLVSHATMQASQSLAIESYYRETISGNDTLGTFSKLLLFANKLGIPIPADIDDGYASLGSSGTNIYPIIKNAFIYAIADSETTADNKLKKLGVIDGLNGIDFSKSAITGSDIIVFVQYKVKFPYQFFGEIEVNLTKAAKSKAFKSIETNNGYQEPPKTE